MKVVLIFPENDHKYRHLSNGYKSFPPPIGLEILAKNLECNINGLSIVIFDGNSTPFNNIINAFDADYIGVSDWFTNHNNCMLIAKTAKEKNDKCTIVVGGPNATHLGDRILRNHPYIDFVVSGDGEDALLQLIKQSELDKIPNLWYRDADEVRYTYNELVDLNSLECFNLEHLFKYDLRKYDSRQNYFFNSKDLSPFPISSVRGCIKAISSKRCLFCALPQYDKVRLVSPEKFWAQIKFLQTKYGINKFFESGDDFIVGNYHEKILASKPDNLNIHLRIYANVSKLDKSILQTLSKIGVKEIFLGIENIDPNVLKSSNKIYDTSIIKDNLRLIEELGIHPFVSFIFGLPGETKESMLINQRFASELSYMFPKMEHISYNAGVPLIGSDWYKMLEENDRVRQSYHLFTNKDLIQDDDIDYEILFLLSLKKYTSLTFSEFRDIFSRPLHPRLQNEIAGFGCIVRNIELNEKYTKIAQVLFES